MAVPRTLRETFVFKEELVLWQDWPMCIYVFLSNKGRRNDLVSSGGLVLEELRLAVMTLL